MLQWETVKIESLLMICVDHFGTVFENSAILMKQCHVRIVMRGPTVIDLGFWILIKYLD